MSDERLREAVIEAAKQWRLCIIQDAEAFQFGEDVLKLAVDALNQWENEHPQKVTA